MMTEFILRQTITLKMLFYFLRFVPGLAMVSNCILYPSHTNASVYVLHAGDATIPALPGEKERGRRGPALPQGS